MLEQVLPHTFTFETPKYRTHEEIGKLLYDLAKSEKGHASLEVIGQSLEERDIYCLHLGNRKAENRILIFANAHGEELRGTEELLHFSKTLLGDNELRRRILSNYYFTILPTVNPDAREYNLRWANEKINLVEFFLTARRTIADKDGIEADIEWGYPLNKRDKRIIRRPETAAIKSLMDAEKFDLLLDVHGALNGYDIGFWYLVGDGKRNRKQCVNFLYQMAKHSGLPLIEREKMEADLCLLIKPGVHTLCTAKAGLKKFKGNKPLTDWFKKELGASSFDYLMQKNPDAQAFVAELPTFYHERFMDMTPSRILRRSLRQKSLNISKRRLKNETIPLADTALDLCQHPILVKYRNDLEKVTMESIKNSLSKLKEEHGDNIATMGEIKAFNEMSKYWMCPGYGRGGLGGVISRLPKNEQKKLKNHYKLCRGKVKVSAREIKKTQLRELLFFDSVNLQCRTLLGLTLSYFA